MDDFDEINIILDDSFGNTPTDKRKRWLEWTVLGYEMFSMLAQPHYGERGVVLKETGELIGAVGIVPYRDKFNQVTSFNLPADTPASAEVGLFWTIAPVHQRKGYATEAARALIDHLFNTEGLGRIIATTGYNNIASQRVMEKLGMTVYRLEDPQPPDLYVVGVLERKE